MADKDFVTVRIFDSVDSGTDLSVNLPLGMDIHVDPFGYIDEATKI